MEMRRSVQLLVAGALAVNSSVVFAQSPTPDLSTLTGNQFDLVFGDDPSMRQLALATLSERITADGTIRNSHLICAPYGATPLQAAKIVELYLDQHPQFLSYPMHAIVQAALAQAFPCVNH